MKKIKIDLDKEIKSAGIGLIVLGVIHLLLSGFLSGAWGIALIIAGIVALLYRSKNMLMVFGTLLVTVGFLNLYFSLFDLESSFSFFWVIFGGFQIYWGIKEGIRFFKIKENPKYDVKEKRKKGFVWYGLRIGFALFALLWIGERIFSSYLENALETNMKLLSWLIILEVAIPSFVLILSIISMILYRKKAFAVFALLVVSLFLLLTLQVALYNFFNYAEDYSEDYSNSTFLPLEDYFTEAQIYNIENHCIDYCSDYISAETFVTGYDDYLEEVDCYCFDINEETVGYTSVPENTYL